MLTLNDALHIATHYLTDCVIDGTPELGKMTLAKH